MDRSLDEVISERQRGNYRSRDRRPPRDGIRKTTSRKDEPRNLDSDWVHDRFEDNDDARAPPRRGRQGEDLFRENDRRRSPEPHRNTTGTKIRVDNLHYDLTEDEIRELFNRIGPVDTVELLYDRQDRSRGTAFVVMKDIRDARVAVREYDGANANGQPIHLALLPTGPAAKPRNPFDFVERPSRSLFERIEQRSRSESPGRRPRRNDNKAAPENIDRYVPGQRNDSRRRSPLRRGDGRRGGGGGGRRPGERRQGGENGNSSSRRPRKTQEELDAEMADYWGGGAQEGGAFTDGANDTPGTTAPTATNDDIDMIE